MTAALTVRSDLSSRIREIENVFIPLAEGIRLAARVFLPINSSPAPAVLEYLPYRKRDFMRSRDESLHRYIAAHGYVAVRVDVRGSGDSDGVLADEYSPQELTDALAVVAWIAEQPWCDGAVGMMGISWGGFNALQVAAMSPPALRAVITLCASDDRYTDDAHYMGGCLLNENMQWGSILMTYNAMPPDPAIVGERWRDMWKARLDAAVAFPDLWMSHQSRDEYWRRGSVCEDYASITCPVYAIGGWADGYSNAVGRLLSGLTVPRKGLIGPWAHTFPHRGYPGPAIGFLQEALRWWDHWLRGHDTGIMDEPMLRVWMQSSVSPAPHYDERPGRWVAETEWPSPRVTPRRWAMNRRRLSDTPETGRAMMIASPQIAGSVSGEWCAFGSPGEMPLDQRPDDGRSLLFDGDPLDQPLEILGAATVELDLASDVAIAMVAVRLNEVAPGGASTRVTYGLLNLTHRHGHASPVPLEPGKRLRVTVELNDIAHTFSPGNRIRIAVSTTYWPLAWPPPEPALLKVWPGTSALTLPIRSPDPAGDAALPDFHPPEEAASIEHRPLRPLPFRRSVERDLVTNEMVYTLRSDGGEFENHSLARLDDIDLTIGYSMMKQHRIQADDPLTAQTRISQRVDFGREDWQVQLECETSLQAERGHLRFTGELRAFERGQVVVRRVWDRRIPRKGP